MRTLTSRKPSRAEIDTLTEGTGDAYSCDRYGRSWRACAALLLRWGYTVLEAEVILRSKHTRWAGDASNKRYGHVTSADLARYMKHQQGWDKQVAQMMREEGHTACPKCATVHHPGYSCPTQEAK